MVQNRYGAGSLTLHPLFKEIHPTKNVGIDITLLSIGSNKKIWWQCLKFSNHEWFAPIDARTKRGNGCKVCSGRLVLPGINDLSTLNPDLARQWNHDKNTEESLHHIPVTSSKKVWWTCSMKHEWKATVGSRNDKVKPSGCPFCSGRKAIKGTTDLQSLRPDLASQWDADKNSLTATEVTIGAAYNAWWICPKNHSYQMIVNARAGYKKGNCPYCSGQKTLKGFNDIATTHSTLLKEWNFAKNPLSPYNLSAGSNYKVWWICSKNHEWECVINKRTRLTESQGCPFCSGQRVLSDFNSLHALFPDLSNQWDYSKNSFKPADVTAGTKRKAWWVCSSGHSYEMSVSTRTGPRNGNCFYCSGQRIMVGFNDLETTHSELLKEWDFELNDKSPREVSLGSEYRAFWKCKEGHSWQTSVYNRTKATNPTGCIKCAESSTSKIQQAFHKALTIRIPDLQCDVRLPVPFKSRKSMSIDMVSIASNVVIEYDGRYYHSGERSGETLQYHLDHDSAKTQALLDAGYWVVRIRENGLQHLDMNNERLMQISYKNGDLMDAGVDNIKDYLNNRKIL
jgi:hypothetical protein